jgi:Tol biopolymer transport system component/predicted Ser/Thr protein kinase
MAFMPLDDGYLLNNRYRIMHILGQGGMGAVYRATDANLDVNVAVKENFFLTEEYARQFQREAQILATLRHPNLPRVFDYFVIDQQGQYLVMDYIEGDDLRQWMAREDQIPEIEALQIGITICDALTYLHSREPAIIHRDIKPGNVKITPDGEVVLVDFGLAKMMSDRTITTTAARAMTPGFSPPEQYGEAPTDARSDIYSLGATLYAALTGYIPEDGLARATGGAQLTSIRRYAPEVSRRTAQAVEKALEIRFEDRWQSVVSFKNALLLARNTIPEEHWVTERLAAASRKASQIADTGVPLDPPAGPWGQFWRRFRRRTGRLDPVWLIFGLTMALLILVLVISFIRPQGLRGIFAQGAERTPTASLTVQPDATTENATLLPGASLPPTKTPTTTPDFAAMPSPMPSPTPQGGAGMLAFVSDRSGIPQIWRYDMVTGRREQLSDVVDGACQPDWAPDGSRIVFTSPCPKPRDRYPGSSLYVLDLGNGEVIPLPAPLEGDFDPAWSPDGEWIAYTSLINGKMQLVKINLLTFQQELLSDGAYDDSKPAWSPDGETIAFERLRGVSQIWLMDADGGNNRQFSLSGAIDNTNPAWHTGDAILVFSQALGLGSPSKQLRGMRLEDIGQNEEYWILPRTEPQYIPLMDHADFSPDGYWLAFDYWYSDVLSDIYIMLYPGANLTQLTTDPGMDFDPVWGPGP